MGRFLIGFVLGGVTVLGALKYHVLRTDDGIEIVPKLSGTFSDTYVDTRGFDTSDWANHKTVMAAVVSARKEHVLKDTAATELVKSVGGMLEGLGFSEKQ